MKGLLIKDASVLMKTMRFFAILNLLMAVYPNDATRGFAIIYAVLTPMSAFALDEQAKWNELAVMMPYSTKDFVISKYVLGIVCSIFITFLTVVSGSVLKLFPFAVENCSLLSMQTILPVFAASLILLALNLPILFKLGVEKGRNAYVFLSVGLAMALMKLLYGADYKTWVFPLWMKVSTMLGIGVVLLLISVLLSIKIYDSKKS